MTMVTPLPLILFACRSVKTSAPEDGQADSRATVELDSWYVTVEQDSWYITVDHH